MHACPGSFAARRRRSVFGACAFAQPRGIGVEHLADLVPHAAELRQHLLLVAFGVCGVIEAPVMAIHLPGIEGARLVGVAADSDDGLNLAVEKCVHVLRCVGGNVDADLLQHLDRLGVDKAGGFRPRAVHVDEVAGGGMEDAFSHVAAAGITGAEDEDVGFHDKLNRVTTD
jgi:hypothetical protein